MNWARENPAVIGGFGLVIGAFLAGAFPTTRVERQVGGTIKEGMKATTEDLSQLSKKLDSPTKQPGTFNWSSAAAQGGHGEDPDDGDNESSSKEEDNNK